ncbi:MAG: iron-sulfur cluster insertion protein ErpA [Thaumarchaeota archaeon]|jgi:iron-sulfur cluster assembly protein|nr:iron-sulfur cluster insertion protein ErpA [Nitrososphaerota archaeon]|tara:strand:+ start:8625 stop:8963 length:339 start_codon:yes stop_codon:yes gene_type:complete
MSETELVTISQKAVDKVKEFSKNESKDNPGLRVYVAGGGCAGLTYGMSLEDKDSQDDIIIETEGLKLFIDPFSAKYLQGSSIDYVESLESSGFKINNPNVSSTCACGKSVSV